MLFFCFLGSIEERQKIYVDAWEKFPKGLVPRRLPLNFLSGAASNVSLLLKQQLRKISNIISVCHQNRTSVSVIQLQ